MKFAVGTKQTIGWAQRDQNNVALQKIGRKNGNWVSDFIMMFPISSVWLGSLLLTESARFHETSGKIGEMWLIQSGGCPKKGIWFKTTFLLNLDVTKSDQWLGRD